MTGKKWERPKIAAGKNEKEAALLFSLYRETPCLHRIQFSCILSQRCVPAVDTFSFFRKKPYAHPTRASPTV